MKKILCLILTIAIMLSLVGCNASAPDTNDGISNGGLQIDGIDSGGGSWWDGLFGNGDKNESEGGNASSINGGIMIPEEIPDEETSQNKFSENTFVSTSNEPTSTFSADVDTASYTYFRKLVESRYSLKELIATAGNSIRTEEMVNYFNYNYAAPGDNELFSKTVQIAQSPWNSKTHLLVVGLQAAEAEIATKNNLVFLIDVSGFMLSQDKLPLLQQSFAYLVDNLGEDDVVSIVTYSGYEAVVLDGCSGAKKETILNAINSLKASGSTNGEAGLKKAYQIAEQHFISDGNNRIILASDGDLNVGMSSVDEIQTFISDKRDQGIFMSVLGFGTGNYKDSMMETIADHGNGVYYYVDSEIEAEKIFGEEICSTLYTIAKDVKMQLSFNPDYITSYRLIGYENRVMNNEDFENDTKDAGDLGSGHSVTVCYEIVLSDAALEASSSETFIDLSIRYKDPNEFKSQLEEASFGIDVYTTTPDDNFKFISCVIETSMILHNSQYINKITLSNVMQQLQEITLNDEYKIQFKTLIETLNAQSK